GRFELVLSGEALPVHMLRAGDARPAERDPQLVRTSPARPAVAAEARPLRDPRQRGDAATDAGPPRRPALRGVAATLAGRRRGRGGEPWRRPPRMDRARVQRARAP